MAQHSNIEIGKAIIAFQYVERIKSELIIATKLLDRLAELSGDELAGASKISSFYFEAIEGDMNIAYNVTGMKEFEMAAAKVKDAADKTHYSQYEEAIKLAAEAISQIASTGQWAMQILKSSNLL